MVIMMICGLFSSFDPGVMGGGNKWCSMLILLMVYGWSSFLLFTSTNLVVISLTKKIKKMMMDLYGSSFHQVFLSLVSIFTFVLFLNLLGMLPFFFSITSHLSVNLSVSLVMWMGGVLYLLMNSPVSLFSHLVPTGAPVTLWPLLVVVESVSLVIRPFTLAIRLMANVMAGHLIINLVGDCLSKASLFMLTLSPLSMMGFLIFEMGVSVIQAFVFMNLMSMYWKESEIFFLIMSSKPNFQLGSPSKEEKMSFMFFILGMWVVCALLISISTLMFLTHLSSESGSPFECGIDPINETKTPFFMHFFYISILFLLFDIELVITLPLVMCPLGQQWSIYWFIFFFLITLSLLVELYLGTLNWKE